MTRCYLRIWSGHILRPSIVMAFVGIPVSPQVGGIDRSFAAPGAGHGWTRSGAASGFTVGISSAISPLRYVKRISTDPVYRDRSKPSM